MADQAMEQKRILMFCTGFFGYDKRLAGAFRSAGYHVDLFDERPGTGFVHKSCIRFNVPLYRPVIRKYIRSVIEQVKENVYDYIFVVKGEGITEEAIEMLREAFPKAKTILYLWDSVQNIPECEDRMRHYHKAFTFDPEDAKRYNLPYLPLPYDESSFAFADEGEYAYDVSFIGTAHSVRPRVVKEIARQCEEMGRRCFVYFYSPHPLVFLYHKCTNRNFRKFSWKEVHFLPLSHREIHEVYQKSRCILDVEHPKQTGATTRPIEMLPMKKKVITTNPKVKEFPFYRAENFLLIDRDQVLLEEAFFQQKYTPVPQEMVDRYSPLSFVSHIMQDSAQ